MTQEDEEKPKGNVIGGDVEAKADLAGTTVEGGKPKPGAIVEDESLAGTTEGGVVPKDPSGQAVEGEATDPRENPSS